MFRPFSTPSSRFTSRNSRSALLASASSLVLLALVAGCGGESTRDVEPDIVITPEPGVEVTIEHQAGPDLAGILNGMQWPTAYLPVALPEYPSGEVLWEKDRDDTVWAVTVHNAHDDAFDEYMEMLTAAGWQVQPDDFFGGYEAHRDGWEVSVIPIGANGVAIAVAEADPGPQMPQADVTVNAGEVIVSSPQYTITADLVDVDTAGGITVDFAVANLQPAGDIHNELTFTVSNAVVNGQNAGGVFTYITVQGGAQRTLTASLDSQVIEGLGLTVADVTSLQFDVAVSDFGIQEIYSTVVQVNVQ